MTRLHLTCAAALRRSLWLALVAGLMLALHGPQLLDAAPRTPRQVVVGDATNSLRPQIAADSANNLHIVWYDGGERDRSVKYAKGAFTGSGYAWTSAIVIYAPGGAPSYIHPRIAVDQQDQIHVVWSWKVHGADTVFYQRWPAQAGPGQSSGPQVLGAGLLPAITTDGSSRVHVAWEQQVTETNFEILYREAVDGNFGPIQNISNNARESLSPDLVVDTSGIVHLVWYDKTPGAQTVLYTRRLANGWQPAQGLSAPDSVFPGIAADGQGCVHIVWNEVANETIIYRRSCNGQLEVPRTVSGGGQPRRPTVGSNAAGNIVVAWDDKAGASNIFFVTAAQGTWSQPTRLVPASTNQLWADAVGLPNGQLAVVWQEDRGGQFDPAVSLLNLAPPTPAPTPAPPAAPPAPAGPPTGTFDFANASFRNLWARTDSLVQSQAVSYSWIWGPAPFTQGLAEYYAQSPGQARTVQYFDKSRMEINQPGAPQGPFYVTNGRLADELITGQMQVGDAQYEQRGSAAIPVAGDPQNTFPLYRDLAAVYRKRGGDRANQLLTRTPDGGVRTDVLANANADPSMVIAQRVNDLGIPKIFWDYMQRSGRVTENGRVSTAAPLFDWRYVIGEPLTEAYWTVVKVGGQDRGVLIQAFERRVLTYTPSNPDEFKVEMGNIGRHYFEWRYGVRPR